jgi:hypothetical protein
MVMTVVVDFIKFPVLLSSGNLEKLRLEVDLDNDI